MKTLITLTILLMGSITGQAAELRGRVVDREGNPIPHVSVVTNLSGVGTMADSLGQYLLSFPDSSQEGDRVTRVTFSSVAFQPRQFAVQSVPPVVTLAPMYYRGTDVTVSSSRAESGLSAVAFDNLSQDEIKRDYSVSEFPLLLSSTPNLYSYSDAGSALGYSYMSIRGFDDKRVSTYINGVPLNDPEDQATYFVDLPDFASSVTDIQVQRGVGNALYGDAAFGGSVNIATRNLSQDRKVTFTSGFGQYTSDGKFIGDISRQAVEYSSGLLDGRWHMTGRFSRQKSSGYRYGSWYDGWAYYYSLARLDPNMTTEIQLYGGPMTMHLAYYGTDRADLVDDRRLNYLTYENETDNFNQPHYQLHHTWQLNERTTLDNTLYYIQGKGYYEQYKGSASFGDYGIDSSLANRDPDGNPYTNGDLVRQQHVTKRQFGWNPRIDIQHARGLHSFGGSAYYFTSEHWGQVVWAQNIGGPLDPNFRYYEYFGKKWVTSAFAQEQYQVSDQLTASVTAQLRYQRYSFDQTRQGPFRGYDYAVDWLFFSPRLGLHYQLTDRVSFYGFAAVSSRTPTDAAIYDASDPYAAPSLEIQSFDVQPSGDTLFTFGDPTGASERVYNFELGTRYQSPRMALSANLFWMDFRDEILPYGGINPSTGVAYTVNADRSVHAGLELAGDLQLHEHLTFSSNLALNYNRVKEYAPVFYYSVDSANISIDEAVTVDYADQTLPLFPGFLGNMTLDYHQNWFRATFRLRTVGRQYLELGNIDSLAIHAYNTAHLSLAATVRKFAGLGNLTATVRIDNLFDLRYEASGYGGNYAWRSEGEAARIDGWAQYYVAGERTLFGQIAMELF